MRGMSYKQASRRNDADSPMSPEVREALARQAAGRPAKGPPKAMPVTPTLPRVPKPYKRRKPR